MNAGEPSDTATRAPISDGLWCAGLALALRLAAAAWGATRFPPAEDGRFYHIVATRIAEGLGYTWLWPDGAVTYAAHYPVGYPAIVGALYAVVGPSPVVAMMFSAVLGALAVLAVHRIAAREAGRRAAAVAALLVGLHPALIFYTPALMTEGVVASVLALASWAALAARTPNRTALRVGGLGLVLGACALLRPQMLLIAPVFGYIARAAQSRRAVVAAAVVTVIAVAVCLPWTLRNCSKMGRCVLVSANGGWNLFIGTAPEGKGAFVPLEKIGVPAECREVFGEADKDVCFREAALRRISSDPGAWLALVPSKLGATFDYDGAPGAYLHTSNPEQFDKNAKIALGVIETLWQRAVVFLSLRALWRLSGRRMRERRILGKTAALFLLLRPAWVAYLGVVLQGALLGRAWTDKVAVAAAVSVTAATAVTHAAFFGAGRYAIVCFPLLALLGGLAFDTVRPARDTRA